MFTLAAADDAPMAQTIGARKKIGLVAHDNKKRDLIEWARYNRRLLAAHDLVATGTTGTLLETELGVGILKLQSGPSAATSSSAPLSPTARSTSSCSSGTRSSRNRTIRMSRRSFGSRSSGTFPWRATAPQPTS